MQSSLKYYLKSWERCHINSMVRDQFYKYNTLTIVLIKGDSEGWSTVEDHWQHILQRRLGLITLGIPGPPRGQHWHVFCVQQIPVSLVHWLLCPWHGPDPNVYIPISQLCEMWFQLNPYNDYIQCLGITTCSHSVHTFLTCHKTGWQDLLNSEKFKLSCLWPH